ncbi:MAG: fused MFS/spermidine synthase [Candidatus Puniceispirillum sp.]
MPIQILLSTTVLVSSACGLVIEIVAGRLLAPIFGMSLYTWTSIIAVVLAGLSIGHWIGGHLTRGRSEKTTQFLKIGAALYLSCFSSLLSLLLLNHVPEFLKNSELSVINEILFSSLVLFFLPSLFVGIVSPLATKLAIDAQDAGEPGLVIGRMYALGSAGAIFGALLSGYFLISMLGSRNTVILVAATYFLFGSIFLVMSSKLGLKLLMIPFALGLSLIVSMERLGALNTPCFIESKYFCIQVQELGGSDANTRLIALDHLVHSINEKDRPERLHSPYVHFVDEYANRHFGTKPPDSFLIGGGGYSLPRAWIKKYSGAANITIAEIDPAVTAVAKSELWFAPTDSNTRVTHGDARYVLERLRDIKFDLIFGDAFHDISIPQHLVTKEFNDLVSQHLNKSGAYIVNVVDESSRPLFLLSYVKTLQMSFDTVDVWFELGIQKPNRRATFLVIGTNAAIEDDFISAENGFERSWWRWPRTSLARLKSDEKLPVLTDNLAPVDHLMRGLLVGSIN